LPDFLGFGHLEGHLKKEWPEKEGGGGKSNEAITFKFCQFIQHDEAI
jgi:hypothetical protein